MTNARIVEVFHDTDGFLRAAIQCPPESVPSPGAYVMAVHPQITREPLATPLFLSGYAQSLKGFVAAPPIPESWQPGDWLSLGSTLGRGFLSSQSVSRLALVSLGSHCARLLPLAADALASGGAVSIFTDAPLPRLSPSIEARPIIDLPEAFAWADHIVLDSSLGELQSLNIETRESIPAHSEVLLHSPLPCAGLADCGICAVPLKLNKWAYACTDGPVFSYGELNLL
ncbi:MAG: hypothetical protein EPO32_03405 [Anaerolineae bacterium]|nr:MAG: hypothetical protein EPO32_03405 [Anaerolineae bacterium]